MEQKNFLSKPQAPPSTSKSQGGLQRGTRGRLGQKEFWVTMVKALLSYFCQNSLAGRGGISF